MTAVNEVGIKLRRPAVDFFSDLFQGERTFVCTLPEFDPYARLRAEPSVWPFNVPDMPEAREFAQRRGPAVFCYMQSEHPALDTVLKALRALDCPSAVYVGGVRPGSLADKWAANLSVYTTPADLRSILPETSALVHHGGLGTTYAGLMAGVPQVVLPVNLEQLITARGLNQFKVAIPVQVTPLPQASVLRGSIEAILNDAARRASSISGSKGPSAASGSALTGSRGGGVPSLSVSSTAPGGRQLLNGGGVIQAANGKQGPFRLRRYTWAFSDTWRPP